MMKVEIDKDTAEKNASSHVIGIVDDCYRCVYCEIGSWNAWKEMCDVRNV